MEEILTIILQNDITEKTLHKMKKFLLLLVIVFLSSCEKEVHPIIDSDLKSIDQIRQLELYEYDKIGNDKNGDKTIFSLMSNLIIF